MIRKSFSGFVTSLSFIIVAVAFFVAPQLMADETEHDDGPDTIEGEPAFV
jgi:hypothetical protein